MTQEPPPLPETSRKRILPAFLLCFTLCAHRIYAGKIVSGIIQTCLINGAGFWAYKTVFKGLMAAGNSGSDDTDLLDRLNELQQAHGASSPLPLLVMIGAAVWIVVDVRKLIAGKFTDGKGLPITRWI